jgi:cytoskeletal protein CcmA (bactofilin family)
MPNVVTKNGHVGIGSTNPTNTLDITDNETGLLALRGSNAFGTWQSLLNTSAGGRAWAFISTGASNSEGAGKLMIYDQSPRLTIDTNGNVGIGTVNPNRKLDVNGSAHVEGALSVNGNTLMGGLFTVVNNANVNGLITTEGVTSVGRIRYASEYGANPARTFDITSGGGIDLVGNSDIYMNSRGARKHILFNTDAGAGNIGIGTIDPSEKLHVNGNIRAKVIIIEGGADLAESYDVAPAGEVQPTPGMVVSIDPDHVGKLRIATSAYDRTVAGIISGADGVAPGLILGQKGTVADGEHPIANVGRVWCFVDADANGPVTPGDLLTTSKTPGHAMKVSDHSISGGAILGKAMSRLESGKGLVLVLVTLQ